ncbi:MAG: heme exporter protein CcmD [Alphaproteobacteria bacterium]
MAEFLSMGGHAAFIWPAYGVAATVLIALVFTSLRMARAAEAEVHTLEESAPPRTGREDGAPQRAGRGDRPS